MDQYGAYVKGVVVNGNKRFGMFYCAAGPKIVKSYAIPLIRNIEGDGNDEDVIAVNSYIQNLHLEKESK